MLFFTFFHAYFWFKTEIIKTQNLKLITIYKNLTTRFKLKLAHKEKI